MEVIQAYKGIFPNGARWAMVSPDAVTMALKKCHMEYDTYKLKAEEYVPIFQKKFAFKSAYKALVDTIIEIAPGVIDPIPGLKIVKTS